MISGLTALMIAAVGFSIFGAGGTFVAILAKNRLWEISVAQIGFSGGCLCAGLLAIMLVREANQPSLVPELTLWNWYTFPDNPSVWMSFGLKATWTKAILVSVMGGISWIAARKLKSHNDEMYSDDILLTMSGMYAGGSIFVLAPHLAQAFLGWAALTALAVISIRLSHRAAEIDENATGRRLENPQQGIFDRLSHFLGYLCVFVERLVVDRIWCPLAVRFPNWLIQQAEFLEGSCASLQLVATALGVSTILLTWLI